MQGMRDAVQSQSAPLILECKNSKTASTHHIHIRISHPPSPTTLPLQIDFCMAAASHYFLICFSRFALPLLCALCFLLFVVICLLLCLAFLEQSPFTRLWVSASCSLSLSQAALCSHLFNCVCVCVCAASLFDSVQHWRLPVGIYVYFLIGVGSNAHGIFCPLFFQFSYKFFYFVFGEESIFWQPFALIISAWWSFVRRCLKLNSYQSARQQEFNETSECRNFCVILSVILCVVVDVVVDSVAAPASLSNSIVITFKATLSSLRCTWKETDLNLNLNLRSFLSSLISLDFAQAQAQAQALLCCLD